MKTPDSTKAESSAPGTGAPIIVGAHFYGTSNPKHLRVLDALMRQPVMREALDKVAGVSNGPDIVFKLRSYGLEVPCLRLCVLDRDGTERHPGQYHLTASDRQKYIASKFSQEHTHGI
jgi:hypothetical protein